MIKISEFILIIFILEIFIYFTAILKNWFHLIIILILIEIIILKLFFILVIISRIEISQNIIFIFSTFIVIEARMGVSILTLIVRSHGNDFILI